jgi:hypothetical protein
LRAWYRSRLEAGHEVKEPSPEPSQFPAHLREGSAHRKHEVVVMGASSLAPGRPEDPPGGEGVGEGPLQIRSRLTSSGADHQDGLLVIQVTPDRAGLGKDEADRRLLVEVDVLTDVLESHAEVQGSGEGREAGLGDQAQGQGPGRADQLFGPLGVVDPSDQVPNRNGGIPSPGAPGGRSGWDDGPPHSPGPGPGTGTHRSSPGPGRAPDPGCVPRDGRTPRGPGRESQPGGGRPRTSP